MSGSQQSQRNSEHQDGEDNMKDQEGANNCIVATTNSRTILSPVITAQERKRLILEKRNKERQAKQQHQKPLLAMKKSSSMESFSNSQASSSLFGFGGGLTRKRRRSTSNLNGFLDDNIDMNQENSLFRDISQMKRAVVRDGCGDSSNDSVSNTTKRRWNSSALSLSSRSLLFTDETSQNSNTNISRMQTVEETRYHQDEIEESKKGSYDYNNENIANSKSSLFGAVMQRTSSINKPPANNTENEDTNTIILNSKKNENNNHHDGLLGEYYATKSSMRIRSETSDATITNMTPVKKESSRSVFWNIGVETPSQSNRSNALKSAESPGGFALLKVLDSVTSPYRFKQTDTPQKQSADAADEELSGDVKDEQEEEPMNRLDDWHEAYLKIDHSIGVWDWPIKRRLRIECHPGSCLPGFLSEGREARNCLQSQAIERLLSSKFISGKKSIYDDDENDGVTDSCVQWESACMYWQHPAIHPLPKAIFQNQKSDRVAPTTAPASSISKEDAKASKADSTENNKKKSGRYRRMVGAVRGSNAHLHQFVRLAGIGSLGGLGDGSQVSSTGSLFLHHRRREWQDSFRSLYFMFLEKVRQLDSTLKQSIHRKNNETGQTVQSFVPNIRVAQTYFYSIGCGQVVLFRASVRKAVTENDEEFLDSGEGSVSTNVRIVPMITLSSSSQSLFKQMKSMGIEFEYLNPLKADEDVDDHNDADRADSSDSTKKGDDGEDEESKLVKEELEALRRAQAHGVTAGADVSVSMKFQKKGKKSVTARNLSPIYLAGEDNCTAFFELYLNSFGFSKPISSNIDGSIGDNKYPRDVPLLVCRKIGPFLHSSMKHLVVTSRRQQQQRGSNSLKGKNQASLEIRGPILPCALQELVTAAAKRMVVDHDKNRMEAATSLPEGGHDTKRVDDDVVGSHYFVLYFQAHEGYQQNSLSTTQSQRQQLRQIDETGTAGSAWMNGQGDAWDSIIDEEGGGTSTSTTTNKFHECYYGEVISMAVWDIARRDMITYKVESSGSIEPELAK